MSKIERLFRAPGLSSGNVISKVKTLKQVLPLVAGLRTELCFNIEITSPLSDVDRETLQWILGNPLHPEELSTEPHLKDDGREGLLIEIGPRYVIISDRSQSSREIANSRKFPKMTMSPNGSSPRRKYLQTEAPRSGSSPRTKYLQKEVRRSGSSPRTKYLQTEVPQEENISKRKPPEAEIPQNENVSKWKLPEVEVSRKGSLPEWKKSLLEVSQNEIVSECKVH